MSEISSLIGHLEKCTGPDQEVDQRIARTLCVEVIGVTGICHPADPYTVSIDAALALVERKLPDHDIIVSSYFDNEDGRHGAAELRSQLVYGSKLVCDVRAATPALALCLALLRALELQHAE